MTPSAGPGRLWLPLLGLPVVAALVLVPALDWTRPSSPTSAEDRGAPAARDRAVRPADAPEAPGSAGASAEGGQAAGAREAVPDAREAPVRAKSAVSPGAKPDAAARAPGVTAAEAGSPGCVNSVAAAYTPGAKAASGATPLAVPKGSGRRVPVAGAAALTTALATARPGDTIELADGRYPGKFVLSRAGTAGSPITLVGTCRAVLDGGSGSGYAVHLDGANHWRLLGFTVTGAEKGIMTDRTGGTLLSHLTVGNTGAEAVHFGNFSSGNTVQYTLVHHTGRSKPQFGEGLYFGTAKSNWGNKSGGRPDASNGNRALRNAFRSTTAENIDAKEATSGGVIAGNSFDGSGITGDNFADSVLDMKGVRYQVLDNRTTGASGKLRSGFQTHVITDPATSGCGNTFSGNTFPGLSFAAGQAIELDKKCG